MKTVVFLATVLLGASAAAAQSSYPPEPLGDGITRMGTNPEGQACTPAGYNVGLNAYPYCLAMGGPAEGLDDYPSCTTQVKDRCVQTYTKWTKRRRGETG